MHKASVVSVLEDPPLLERNVRDLMEVFMSKGNRFDVGTRQLVFITYYLVVSFLLMYSSSGLST